MSYDITSTLNYATGNRFLAVVPVYKFFPGLSPTDDRAFNLVSHNLPGMSVGTANCPFLGVNIDIPNGTRDETKTHTFNYIVSGDYRQLVMLQKWMNLMARNEGAGFTTSNPLKYKLDISVYLMSAYEKPVVRMIYRDAYLKSLAEVNLTYGDGGENPLTHSFTVNYSNLDIEYMIDPTT